MKNYFVGIIILFLIVNLFAKVEILSQNSDLIDAKIIFSANIKNNHILPNNELSENFIRVSDDFIIPFYKYNFIIPDYNSVSVSYEILDSTFVDFSFSEILSDTLQTYKNKKSITYTKPFIFRDFRGITLNFLPYKPYYKEDKLLIYNTVELKIYSDTNNGTNPLNIHHQNIPKYFSDLYKHFFVNYSYLRSNNITYEDMIIISTEPYTNYTEDLGNIFTNQGIHFELYTYPNDTGFGYENVANFIHSLYSENEKLTFVLMINDDMNQLGQNQLAYLEGNDLYPELILGTLCFKDTLAFANYNKLLTSSYQKPTNYILSFGENSDINQNTNDKNNVQIIISNTKINDNFNYVLDISDIEQKSFSDKFHNILSYNDITFFSQAPILYSLFHHNKIDIFANPSFKLIDKHSENNIFEDEIKINYSNPLSLDISVNKDYLPLKNCLVSISDNSNVIASDFTDEFGTVSLSLNNDNDNSLYKVIFYHKSIGFHYDFFTSEKPQTQKDTLVTSIISYPNPYYPSKSKEPLTISYNLKKNSFVEVIIYNIMGQVIKNLYSGFKNKGDVIFYWDGKNKLGRYVSSGTYYIVLKTDYNIETTKILLIK
jgi:hypothetical protein